MENTLIEKKKDGNQPVNIINWKEAVIVQQGNLQDRTGTERVAKTEINKQKKLSVTTANYI